MATPSPQSFSEIVSAALRADHGVTFRKYGPNGEFERPMIHRFPASKLKGSVPMIEAALYQHNPLFQRLMQKGRSKQRDQGVTFRW